MKQDRSGEFVVPLSRLSFCALSMLFAGTHNCVFMSRGVFFKEGKEDLGLCCQRLSQVRGSLIQVNEYSTCIEKGDEACTNSASFSEKGRGPCSDEGTANANTHFTCSLCVARVWPASTLGTQARRVRQREPRAVRREQAPSDERKQRECA